MKRFALAVVLLVVAIALVRAHEGNEHVRGVVTEVSPQSITVQTSDKKTTLSVTARTTFQRAGKVAHLADVKVGDRVVVDVPQKTTEALLVQIGAAAAAAPAKTGAAPTLDVVLQVKPATTGENTFQVTVKDAAHKPVTDAEVSVVVTMPAMPAMRMPEMRNEVKLKSSGGGVYAGAGQIQASGLWNVVVSVKQNGVEVAEKKSSLTVR